MKQKLLFYRVLSVILAVTLVFMHLKLLDSDRCARILDYPLTEKQVVKIIEIISEDD